MRRTIVLFLLGAVAALGLWYALRGTKPFKASTATVTALLPKETLAFVHLPDFTRSRAQWRETDLYKLWREPAVQDFLQKPLARVPKSETARAKLQELDALGMTDAFLALISLENNNPKAVGGFRFKGSSAGAEKVVSGWRGRWDTSFPGAKRETMPYEGHSIEVVSKDAITLATVYDGDWFFAGNDLVSLKKLLDRADKRAKDPGTTLSDDDDFKTAMKQMPSNYAAVCYARLDAYMQKLAARLTAEGMENEQSSRLGQIRSVSAATSFANNKIRDVFFIAMPRMEESGELTRTSLALTTKDSFLYAANLLNLPKQIAMPSSQTKARGMPAALQQFVSAFSANGITRDDFDGAFAHEVGVIGDWPEKSRLPGLLATIAVKDIAKARKILEMLETGFPEADKWITSQKDDVQYYSKLPSNPMVPVTPTIALSNRLLVAGLDRSSVESAIKRDASANSSLTATANFKTAESMVPPPRESFGFLDMALLYDRLDTAVRPMLVMAAAFMPAVNEAVDLGKLPAAEVITKHLSPMVASQSYQGKGYLTEVVGPVSVYQVGLALLAASSQGAPFFHGLTQGSSPDPAEEPPSPTTATPSATPDDG